MASKGNLGHWWKEHPGPNGDTVNWWKERLVPRRKEAEATAPAAAAAVYTEHTTTHSQADDGSAIDDIIHILPKLPSRVGGAGSSGVGGAGSCNEEAPGERRINLQSSSESCSDEQTAQDDSGSKCSDVGSQCSNSRDEKTTDVGSQCSDEKMREDVGSDLFESDRVGSAGSCNEEAPGEWRINLQSSSESRSDEQMAQDSGSECSDVGSQCSNSGDKKMTDVGSQCSDEKMREDVGSDLFESEDMGDADSDIIYLEGFPSFDEMEDDICDEMEDEPNYYSDEETGEDDGFDENKWEDDACEQPQWMEVDDGSAAFKEEIDEEVFLCPEDREHILKLKKPSIVSWYDSPKVPLYSSYYRASDIMPINVHASNENSAEYNTHEEKSGGSDISTLSGFLDDAVEVQFERGMVRHFACVDFSSLSYKKSHKLIDTVVGICVNMGMEFCAFPQMLARAKPATLDDVRKTLLYMHMKIFEFITKLEEESAVFLLVILPDDRQYDEKIKELCDKIFDVTYEFCYPYFYNILDWPLRQTACQIRSKVVKHAVRHRRLALPLVSEAPMIIFGADMFRLPGEGSESIATVAASLDWPKFRKYFVMESCQPYGEGIIKDLHNSNGNGGIMIDFFNSFYKRINQNPQRIIFFRNGLEQDQFGPICQQEIDAIKRACAFFNNRYQPQLTYVVVLPMTPIEIIRMDDKSKDILPGTEADPTKFKFWCCHRGQKNLSFVRYHVVHDDNNFPAHELQSLTSKLCTFRHRWASPEIDIVPPAYYARSAALDAIQEWRKITLK